MTQGSFGGICKRAWQLFPVPANQSIFGTTSPFLILSCQGKKWSRLLHWRNTKRTIGTKLKLNRGRNLELKNETSKFQPLFLCCKSCICVIFERLLFMVELGHQKVKIKKSQHENGLVLNPEFSFWSGRLFRNTHTRKAQHDGIELLYSAFYCFECYVYDIMYVKIVDQTTIDCQTPPY